VHTYNAPLFAQGLLIAVSTCFVHSPFSQCRTSLAKFLAYNSKIRNECWFEQFCRCVLAYRPPDSSSDFLHELNRFLKFFADSQFKDVVLIGDFNYPNIQWSDVLP
jgi:hypothetical protein